MTVPEFQKCKRDGKRLVVVTAYDALFARIIEQAGVEIMLVGDSLGVVVQGKPNTLSVTMEDMLYHTGMVVKGAQRSFVISDMPFMSYQAGVEEAVRNAGRLLQAGAAAVKLEGGGVVSDQVRAISRLGIPVMAFWGLSGPATQALMSRRVNPSEQGQLQGAIASINGVTGLIGPMLFTQVFAYFISSSAIGHLPGAPFLLASMLLGTAAWIAWRTTRSNPEPAIMR